MACVSWSWLRFVRSETRHRLATFRRYSDGASATFPGAPRAPYASVMEEASTPCSSNPIPIFRMMDENGQLLPGVKKPNIDNNKLLEIYKKMTTLNYMDQILYDAQRQGRISFYMTNSGEEGAVIASAAALELTDTIYGQYREAGAIMWRGYSLRQCMDQCYGNRQDQGHGKQMPVHYGDNNLNFQTISSCLSTQMPQAPGYAYALKLQKSNNCVMCYFGDGAAQEGDAHAALNFAATLGCPVIFFCRNNGYAISTPTSDQYAGDGIVVRGLGYGIESIRVDGNDVLATHEVTSYARRTCIKEARPILIEAMTYRIGHHSTSDDSSKYRSTEEVSVWSNNYTPIKRLKKFLISKQLWSEQADDELVKQVKDEIMKTFQEAEKEQKPNPSLMFTEVYSELPAHLQKQREQMWSHVRNYPSNYPLDKFESDN